MRKIGAVAIAIVGLVVLVQSTEAVGLLASLLVANARGGNLPPWLELLAWVVPLALYTSVGGLLVWNRHRLADRLFPDEPVDLSIDAPSLLHVALIVLAVALVAMAVPAFVRETSGRIAVAAQLASLNKEPLGLRGTLQAAIPAVMGTLLQLTVGLLLLAGSRRLADRLWWGRPVKEAKAQVEAGPVCSSCGLPFDPADYRGGLSPARCVRCGEAVDIGGAEQPHRADRQDGELDSQG